MQLTRKQLKQIISEEIENVANEKDEVESLLEGYSSSYEQEEESDFVSKQAVIDFLEVMSENKIPKIAFEAFMNNLPEESVTPILKEALEE
jgi:hypothetical protein